MVHDKLDIFIVPFMAEKVKKTAGKSCRLPLDKHITLTTGWYRNV